MIFLKVDFERQRLVVLTGVCHDFVKNQVKFCLKTEENDFKRFKLLLKDVSYSNLETREVLTQPFNHTEEIRVLPAHPVVIDVDFLKFLVRENERIHDDVLRGRNLREFRWLQRRMAAEKILAKNMTAMQDFSFLKVFVRPLLIHPGIDRRGLKEVWDELTRDCQCFLETEMNVTDPYIIREETRRLFHNHGLPFDNSFYSSPSNFPEQKSFVNNIYRLKEIKENDSLFFGY
jgi:hypothetical protein